MLEGDIDGGLVGNKDGFTLGVNDGGTLGVVDGVTLGVDDGLRVGGILGAWVSFNFVGVAVFGVVEGTLVVGRSDGATVGLKVGGFEGVADGRGDTTMGSQRPSPKFK